MKCEPKEKLMVKPAACAWLSAGEPKCNMAAFPYILFFLYFSFLPWLPYRPHVSLSSSRTTRNEVRLLLLIYVSISVFIHYPLCSQGFQLCIAFQSNCEQHDNCISVAYKIHTTQKMYTELIYIPVSWSRGIYWVKEFHYFLLQGNIRKTWLFPSTSQHFTKTKPHYAVVVEYCILPCSVWLLLWATCAGWRRLCVCAAALGAMEGTQ